MRARGRARLLAAGVPAVLAACALPPPPGAFIDVAYVRPSDIPASRPLAEVQVSWEALLHDTAPVPGCDVEACAPDPAAWFARCLEPRASDAARKARQQLLAAQRWHAAALASLRAPPSAAGARPSGCDGQRLTQETAARVVHQVGALAAAEAAAACPALELRSVTFALNEIDRSRESFGEWLRHDYPAIVGASFVGMFTGAVAMPVGDTISRIATLKLDFAAATGEGTQPAWTLAARGGASVKIASGKVLQADAAPPPQLVPVALAAAIGGVDGELQSFAAAGCRTRER